MVSAHGVASWRVQHADLDNKTELVRTAKRLRFAGFVWHFDSVFGTVV